jgi:hypothetical protein
MTMVARPAGPLLPKPAKPLQASPVRRPADALWRTEARRRNNVKAER